MEEITETDFIPSGWATCILDDIVVKMCNGANVTQYEEKVGYPISRIETIWNESIDLERVKYIKENDEAFVDKYSLRYGDILLSHINSDLHLGKTGIFRSQTKVLIHGINILLIRPSTYISAEFLNYQFKYLRSRGLFIQVAQRAVNQSSINQQKLKHFKIHLPPLSEQHRIVTKIEALFSELDKGIESFKTAREQLKIYRQALLKHAFSGKLTEQWRAENQDKLESAEVLLQRIQTERQQRYQQQLKDWEANGKPGSKPKAPKTLPPLTADELAELPELPKGWGWVRLGELASIIAGNAFEKAEYSSSGVRLFQIANVGFGEVIWDKTVFLPDHYWYDYPDLRLFHGDLVMALNRPLLGDNLKISKIGLLDTPAILYQRVGKFIPNCCQALDLIFWYLRSSAFIEALKAELRGVNIPFINQTKLMEYPIPLFDFNELSVVVSDIDTRISIVDQMEKSIDSALEQAEALRQAILKKAFSGQLVAQDPNDEPASVLLERIRAEKAQADTQPARRRGKTA